MTPLAILFAMVALSVGAAFGATNNLAIVSAARLQIGVTVRYVPSYQKLAYPNGDVPREQGVCVDVVIEGVVASCVEETRRLPARRLRDLYGRRSSSARHGRERPQGD